MVLLSVNGKQLFQVITDWNLIKLGAKKKTSVYAKQKLKWLCPKLASC